MADGIITQDEKARLREFRDQLALGADPGAMKHLGKASQDRPMLDARLAAIAVFDGGAHLDSLAETLRQSNLSQDEQSSLLVQAWEAAVEGALEDGLFTLDEENVLTRYINHFNLSQSQLDANGVHTSLIKLDFTQNPGKVMDDITFVRSHWWLVSEGFSLSTANSDVQKLPATLYHRNADSLAYAA